MAIETKTSQAYRLLRQRILRGDWPVGAPLPLIGSLFRSTKTDQQQREIVIFLVPHILDEDGHFRGPLLFERLSPEAAAEALGNAVPPPDR